MRQIEPSLSSIRVRNEGRKFPAPVTPDGAWHVPGTLAPGTGCLARARRPLGRRSRKCRRRLAGTLFWRPMDLFSHPSRLFRKIPGAAHKKARGGGGIRHPTIGITRMNLLSQQSGVRPSSRRLTTGRPTTAASSVQIAADGVASHWRGIRGWVGYGIRTRHRISPSPPAKS